MNVALYLRYSSDKQTEQSIEGQRRVCEQYCKAHDYVIVKEYIDRAHTAFKDIEKRTGFQQMIKDSAKNLFDAIIVYKLDRFSRNRYVSVTYKTKLKRNGVRVLSATENISDNPEGIILESVLEGMAEFYSAELSQKVRRGMNETALKCNSTGGKIPLGYKIENKKFVIDELTAPIVREAFYLYANGNTINEICNIFNNKGYRTSTGKNFNKNSFNKMFNNARYIGTYTYGNISIENGMPSIIDKKTWEAVQKKTNENKIAPAKAKAKVEYLLSGKLFCGHCSSLMTGDTGKSKTGKKYYYYSCSGRKNKRNGCDKKSISKDYIEDIVTHNALEILSDDTIDYLADMAIEQNRKEIASNTQVNLLKDKIDDIDLRISNLMKSIELGVTANEVTIRLNELSDERKDFEKQLQVAESEFIVLKKHQVVWWLNKFKDGNINDVNFRKTLFDMLINSITVWDEPDGYKITTTYNLINNNERTIKIPHAMSSDFTVYAPPKIPNAKAIGIFTSYLLLLTSSLLLLTSFLFPRPRIRDFRQVISNS